MPDAGDFERDERSGGIGWSEAFAALPQETPDAGGWQRVQARLPVAARSRMRWPLWLATAASLVLAVAIPLRMEMSRHSRGSGNPRTLAQAPILASPESGEKTKSASANIRPATGGTSMDGTDVRLSKAARFRGNDEQKSVARNSKSRRTTGTTTPSQRPIRTVAQPADATRIAQADASTSTDLEPLYAQSAQLESLLAMARDERVASGTSAALSDRLDAQVASIDAALTQPGLGDAQRAGLWRQRVDTLQQLAGIETTQRLYASRGESYDAALVSID